MSTLPLLPRRYGWVGLGAMGYPMAAQLVKKVPPGSELCIFDVNLSTTQQFVDENTSFVPVHIGQNAREVAERSDFLVSMVPEGAHVRDVYLARETGVLAANIAGKILVDCSTIDIETTLMIGEAVAKSSVDGPVHFIDAPVSGGTLGAEKGTLTFMVGASEDDPVFPILKHVFTFMGSSIYTLGGRSLGLAAKLSNNYLSSMINLATAEAMNLGMRLGLDPKVFSEVLKTSSGGSWVNSTMNPVPGVCPEAAPSKGYEGGFKIQLMRKDMALAIKSAERVGARLVLAKNALPAYTEAAQDPRCKDRDARVMYRWLGGVEPEV